MWHGGGRKEEEEGRRRFVVGKMGSMRVESLA
jgi:hypothetical protein